MKNIRFQKIKILSYSEKKARIINLDSNFVLIKGTNHVGKSCVLKSLYRALGAEIKKMPDTWDMSTIILILNFTIDYIRFKSLLIGNDLFVLNPDGSIRFKEKIGSESLSEKINSLLGVNLRLVDNSDLNIPVGANFMPFYIDQDAGWSEAWSSFSKVGTLGDKANTRLYLTGIIDDAYFTYKKTLSSVDKDLKKNSSDLRSYQLLSEQVRRKIKPLQLEFDINGFRNRINSYLEKLKQLREIQNMHLRLMQELYSKKTYIELNIEQLKKNIKEIEKDFLYALNLEEVIVCPTCGGQFTNDISSRHELMRDEYVCRDMVIHCNNDLDNVMKQIEAAVKKLEDINTAIEETQNLIKSSNDEISLEEVIEAKSREHMLDLITMQCSELSSKVESLQKEKDRLEVMVNAYEDSGRKEEAESLFADYVVAATKSMGSSVKQEKTRFGGRITATGSALPVSVIAHTFSYLKLIQKYSGPIFMPVVIDEPKQQGLQQQGLNLLIAYMRKTIPKNGQLIVSLADDKNIDMPSNALVVNLDKTGRVLIEDDFEEVKQEIDNILEKDFQRMWNA
ncbi:MAG: hypothetical protein J6T94_04665 [Bacteroidaceae bacterium]|nr:hypothetical protein [Bacteroidaceae bacterium]